MSLSARLAAAVRAAAGSTFGPAVLGALLLLLALPLPPAFFAWLGPVAPNVDTGPAAGSLAPLPGPWYVSLAWLAWIAPVPWLWLVRRRELPGRRPYLGLWLAGLCFWLAELYWLTLPYWATSLGWLALSFYLAFYLPVFVGLARVAVHGLRVPLIAAAPVVWTGLELARGHLITGFTMASLGHTQYRWTALIQVSDLAGAYGVGFLVMLVAACLARMLPKGEGTAGWCVWPLAPAGAAIAAALVYGQVRLGDGAGAETAARPVARIALIQGSIDTEVKFDPAKQRAIMEEYVELSWDAVRKHGRLDLLVWPETMFRTPIVTYDEDAAVPGQWTGTPEEFRERIAKNAEAAPADMGRLAKIVGAPLLLGVDAEHLGRERIDLFNSAVFVDRQGRFVARYDKMHIVMFGEYVPFARWIPLLQEVTPIGAGVTEGERPVAVDIGAPPIRIAPNICYETVLPHVIRRQVLGLRHERREPDVLVNLTNDGWFYGSIELDLHLICGVFRAVEFRKPLVIAANTGFSAWIDGDGRVRALGPRRATGTVLAEVRPDGRPSWYLTHGDWPAGACLATCVAFGVLGVWRRLATGSR